MSDAPLRVLVADALDAEQLASLHGRGIEVLDEAGISAEALRTRLRSVHGLLVRSRTQVDADLLSVAPDLRVVGRAGTGVDNIDLEAATRAGVVVMNVPGGNAVAAAEHTIALMMSLARQIPVAAASLREGRWDRKRFQGTELTGKTLGVVGLGRIGREVAQRAHGLKMRVLAFDPVLTAEVADDMGIGLLPIDELVANVDFLSVHVPLSDATRHLVDRALLAKAKPGLRVLNVARGGIVDEVALLEALESGSVGGVALDVFEQEPPTDAALLRHDRVVATPHLGASTAEAQAGVARAIADQVGRFLIDGVMENAVNAAGLDPASRAELAPWLQLARRLGTVAASLVDGGIRQIDVTLVGEIASGSGDALTTEVLLGLLRPFATDRLNGINAEWFARERGIRVSHGSRPSHKSFQSLLRIAVHHGDEATLHLSGTLFGVDNLRIVRAFGFNIDAIPEGAMLFCRNQDRPGIIGHLGTLLADAGVNIANMSVGRDPNSGEALAVLNLDAPPESEVLAALAAREEIRWVRYVDAGGSRRDI
ncbi:MAG: phosphoglycerate dehydrogenase [Planctomycetes bacterium]|nr:phosphoglycerate dehydrogenase [Planctomycetota bacterium]